MKPETFFEHFALLADAPNGVQKLREMILQLAVRGKLVPQDSSDEPASVLLEKIKFEKRPPSKESNGRTRKQPLTSSSSEETFNIPAGWVLCRLGEISEVAMGNSPPGDTYNERGEGVPLINGPVEFSRDPLGLTIESKFTTGPTKLCKKNDLLICVRGATTGRTNIAGFEACIGRGVALIRAYFYQKYINLFILANRQRIFELGKGSTFPSISFRQITDLVTPLPPLAEQHRIVAKVDQLMALCDELEARQQKRNESRTRLSTAAIDKLLTAHDPDEFAEHWQRICDHFDLLSDTPESIGQLRQAILQLAVQGKLVPQDPKDEPASVLLEKVQAANKRLSKEKGIRGSPPAALPQKEEVPFGVPEQWMWVRLDTLCFQITDGTHHTPQYTSVGIPFLSVKDISKGQVDLSNPKFISPEEHEELTKRCKPEYEDVLLTKVGTTGIAKVIDVNVEFSIFVSVALLKFPKTLISPYYLELLINAPLVKKQSSENTQGVGNKNLVLKHIKNFIVPLPPTLEQHRIVAKVDQLMTLCNKLEAKLKQSQTDSEHLMDVMVQNVLAA